MKFLYFVLVLLFIIVQHTHAWDDNSKEKKQGLRDTLWKKAAGFFRGDDHHHGGDDDHHKRKDEIWSRIKDHYHHHDDDDDDDHHKRNNEKFGEKKSIWSRVKDHYHHHHHDDDDDDHKKYRGKPFHPPHPPSPKCLSKVNETCSEFDSESFQKRVKCKSFFNTTVWSELCTHCTRPDWKCVKTCMAEPEKQSISYQHGCNQENNREKGEGKKKYHHRRVLRECFHKHREDLESDCKQELAFHDKMIKERGHRDHDDDDDDDDDHHHHGGRRKQRRLFLIGGLVASVLSLGLIGFIIRKRRRRRKLKNAILVEEQTKGGSPFVMLRDEETKKGGAPIILMGQQVVGI